MPSRRPVAILYLLAAIAGGAVAAPGALAATVTYSSGGTNPGMTVTDNPGDAANLVILRGDDSIGVRSFAAAVTAGSGCTQVSSTEATCFVSGPRIATVNLSDGNDRLGYQFQAVTGSFVRGGDGNDDIQGTEGADAIDGEAGDDSLQGGGNEDSINGGPGNDVIGNFTDAGNDTKNGGDGNDRLIGFRDPGNDVYNGGAGTDLLDFRGTDVGVRVSLDGVANDGPAGETDNAGLDLENLMGGNGPDTLIGDSDRNLLQGFDGNDSLRGGSPPDLRTFSLSFLGDDTLDGGLGADHMQADGGDDRILARDGIDDQVNFVTTCGPGNDRIDADLADDNTRSIVPSCETVDQGAIDEGRNVRIASSTLRVDRGGSARARLRCPASVTIGCRGDLRAGPLGRAGSSGLGPRSRYRIRRGRRATVGVRVPASLRRAAGRRGGVFARLVSVERGEHGAKTTLVPVRLQR